MGARHAHVTLSLRRVHLELARSHAFCHSGIRQTTHSTSGSMSSEEDNVCQALLLHPVTQEVYSVPRSSIEHDANHPVQITYNAFEDMAGNGCVSAERFLNADKGQHSGYVVTQVMAVRLASPEGAIGGKPMYAWASRLCTTAPVGGMDGPDVEMGREFLWLWPPGKAWNSWITRKENQRQHPDEPEYGIDLCEPSIRYTSKNPGLMLGPDDVLGCTHVPSENLTVMQRLFVSCIKPQQTLFARRQSTSDWTDRLERMTDENQSNFCDTVEDLPAVRWLMKMNQNREQLETQLESKIATRSGVFQNKTEPHYKKQTPVVKRLKRTLGTAMNINDRSKVHHLEQLWKDSAALYEPVHDFHKRKRIRLLENALAARCGMVAPKSADEEALKKEHRMLMVQSILRSKESVDEARQRRWSMLPDDLLVNILCARLGEDLNGTTAQAAFSICSMRLVSKGALAITERFVGAQLDKIVTSFHYQVVAPDGSVKYVDRPIRSQLSSIGVLGMQMRRLGIGAGDVLHLTTLSPATVPHTNLEKTGLVPSSLPRCPKRAPDWRAYLRLRLAREGLLGGHSRVKTPRTAPSTTFVHLYETLREGNPMVNGQRYAAASSGRANLPNPAFDKMLCHEHGDEVADRLPMMFAGL